MVKIIPQQETLRLNPSLNPQRTLAVNSNSDLALITEPQDGTAPIIAAIQSASTSVDLVMYEMNDSAIDDALAAVAKRGVAVRVLINGGYYGKPDTTAAAASNKAAYDYLEAHGVAVHWTPAYFALTHEKSLVIDHATAIIMTFNFTSRYYSTSRDFGMIDHDANDVGAIEAAFNDDWVGAETTAADGDGLVWSPGAENETLSLINGAKTSLDIYNEEMADDNVINALVAAVSRGVAVRIDMTYSSKWKPAFQKLSASGAMIRTYSASTKAPLYIHAKTIIADNSTGFVGSQNFSSASLNENRELGIVFSNTNVIKSLETTFETDWQNAQPF